MVGQSYHRGVLYDEGVLVGVSEGRSLRGLQGRG